MDMKRCVLFGAGEWGHRAIESLGKENIDFFIDNAPAKWESEYCGFKVYSWERAKEMLRDQMIVVSVSSQYEQQILEQIKKDGNYNCTTIPEARTEIIRARIEKSVNYIEIYKKAIQWILTNTIPNKGIIASTECPMAYPEVTGYYIPTLIRWGYKDLAVSYAKWLCEIQKEDGSWYDTMDADPYIFDSAQILKGLIAVREIYPYVDKHILRGCDWILSRMTEEGRLVTPTKKAWREESDCSEVVHIYCLSPLVQAAEIFGKPIYKEKAFKILEWYKQNYYDKIMNFSLLSHFYAYVMEGLLDMGEIEMASEAMKKIEKIQKDSGAVPAYHNVDWICSTGLFQFAVVWFRLGNMECGKKAFEYACKLQNQSGGWYGSYLSEENQEEKNTYIPYGEISWAIKYFLDALYYQNIAEFNVLAPNFLNEISKEDDRYKVICEIIRDLAKGRDEQCRVLDVGCGKGRYLMRLIEEFPDVQYCAVDLSEKVMGYFASDKIEKKQGGLTNIPYDNACFDIVYSCEALEHAVDIQNSIREMARVAKDGGKIIIVDKNIEKLGVCEIMEWEQWFGEKELGDIMSEVCSEVNVRKNIGYNGHDSDGVFCVWVGTVGGK